jgi:hypothetical protein
LIYPLRGISHSIRQDWQLLISDIMLMIIIRCEWSLIFSGFLISRFIQPARLRSLSNFAIYQNFKNLDKKRDWSVMIFDQSLQRAFV